MLCLLGLLDLLGLLGLLSLPYHAGYAGMLQYTVSSVFYLGFLVWGGSCEVRWQSRGSGGILPWKMFEFYIAMQRCHLVQRTNFI